MVRVLPRLVDFGTEPAIVRDGEPVGPGPRANFGLGLRGLRWSSLRAVDAGTHPVERGVDLPLPRSRSPKANRSRSGDQAGHQVFEQLALDGSDELPVDGDGVVPAGEPAGGGADLLAAEPVGVGSWASTTISSSAMPAARAVGTRTSGRAWLRVRGDCQNTICRPWAFVKTIWDRCSRPRSATTSIEAPRRAQDRSRYGSVLSGSGLRAISSSTRPSLLQGAARAKPSVSGRRSRSLRPGRR